MSKELKRVVFSSKKVKETRQLLDDGFQLKREENPYFKGILDVRADNLTFKMTKDELDDYIKCKLDVKYFANNFCYVKVEDGSYKIIKLRDYQLDLLDMFDGNKFSILISSRQSGKCLDLIARALVYDTSSNTSSKFPLYELYFKYKNNLTIYDRLKYQIYKWIDKMSLSLK